MCLNEVFTVHYDVNSNGVLYDIVQPGHVKTAQMTVSKQFQLEGCRDAADRPGLQKLPWYLL